MAQTIYGLVSDNGDGSASMHWYKSQEVVDKLLDEASKDWQDSYNMNEGTYAEVLTFPDGIDLEKCGFEFQDLITGC